LGLRQRWPALGFGSIKFLQPDNRKILVFVREHESQRVMVVANLSRYAEACEVYLAEFRGCVPVEIFGRSRFPTIDGGGYRITLNPHGFYWFALEPMAAVEPGEAAVQPSSISELPPIDAPDGLATLFGACKQATLRQVISTYVQKRRWFGGKARDLKSIDICDTVELRAEGCTAYVLMLVAEYAVGDPESYVLPLARAEQAQAEQVLKENPQAAIARMIDRRGNGSLLYDAMADAAFTRALLLCLERSDTFASLRGQLVFRATRATSLFATACFSAYEPQLLKVEHSNTAVVLGDRYFLKLFRRLEAGINPDVEISQYLTERQFPYVPALGGTIEYRSASEVRSVAIFTQYIPDARDGWNFTLDALSRYFDRVLLYDAANRACQLPRGTLLELSTREPDSFVIEAIGTFLEAARLLGERTANLHLALGSGDEGAFSAEPFSLHYQRSLYQSMRNLLIDNLDLLKRRATEIPDALRADALRIVAARDALLECYKLVYTERISAMRIRVHGDYHLGQVLSTGTDFAIVDFEGEPARALSARRLKRSPLTDVAGMIRSFHYAVQTAITMMADRGLAKSENQDRVACWAAYWRDWVCATFLRAYHSTMGNSRILPANRGQLAVLLDAFLIDKAIYEIGYELNHRPTWLNLPFKGILDVLGRDQSTKRAGLTD
jgi:maltose alpha-D-glucosyltransferase/alpha-amylase